MMLGKILVLETSTESGSVAVASDGGLIAELSFASRNPVSGVRTEALAPAVAKCLAHASVHPRELTAVICGAGPGGFTSLRSAAALAKGLASALQIPLYAVSSLDVLAWSAEVSDGPFVVALPAGRNEWFFADVRSESGRASLVGEAGLIGNAELHARATSLHAKLIGPGLEFDTVPRASAAVRRLEEVEADGPVAIDSWEPVYGRLAEAQVKWEATHGRPLSL
ncbi:MAG: tRNA (adenosine(37)-N6)-threonylcarbamoyltransferase complex dimerization subunit type 1 TsaB [Gemmatimonadaceae bacterium]